MKISGNRYHGYFPSSQQKCSKTLLLWNELLIYGCWICFLIIGSKQKATFHWRKTSKMESGSNQLGMWANANISLVKPLRSGLLNAAFFTSCCASKILMTNIYLYLCRTRNWFNDTVWFHRVFGAITANNKPPFVMSAGRVNVVILTEQFKPRGASRGEGGLVPTEKRKFYEDRRILQMTLVCSGKFFNGVSEKKYVFFSMSSWSVTQKAG